MGMIPLLWVYLHHSWYGEHRPSIGYDILNFCFCFCNLTFSPPGHGESGIIAPLDLFTWVNKSMLTIPLEGRFHCRIKCCVTISMSMPYCEQHDWLDHCHFVVIVQIFLAMLNRDFFFLFHSIRSHWSTRQFRTSELLNFRNSEVPSLIGLVLVLTPLLETHLTFFFLLDLDEI